MRTINELEYILNEMDKTEPSEDAFLIETDALRHLLAIARAALSESHCSMREAMKEAIDAGLFGEHW